MRKSRFGHRVACAAIFCIAVGSFLGCSPEKRYKVLSFFFDGVPLPRGVEAEEGQQIVYPHKPYAEGKCISCHASNQMDLSITQPTNISGVSSSVCLNCHGKIPSQYEVMHGPVSSGECLLCHNPHESSVKHLLVASAPRVCTQCHTPEVMTPRRSEHQDEKASCLNCHFGHGGPAHGLLRPTPPATTEPANSRTDSPPSLAEGRASL